MTELEAVQLARQTGFVPKLQLVSSPPKEWWACIASNLHNEMKDSALCCYVGLCGTEFCPYKMTGKPPKDWEQGDKNNGVLSYS